MSASSSRVNLIHYISPLLPFLLGWSILLVTADFFAISLLNGLAQIVLFFLVVCWPAWKTGRLSYVDIAWPWGLVLIAVATYTLSDGYWLRSLIISLVYGFIGARMGLGALKMWHLGYLQTEFPRYQYQRLRWEKAGKTNVSLLLQIEAWLQGLANAGFLAFPAFIIASNSDPEFSPLEIAGLLVWVLAFSIETIADMQKLNFLRRMKQAEKKNSVCNIGLWRYSRHPNYFAEWLVWTAMVIAAIPSWLTLYTELDVLRWSLLGAGLLFVPKLMHTTLVYHTGAVPAEYYSAKKRPGYKNYQMETNRFFPGPVKHRD